MSTEQYRASLGSERPAGLAAVPPFHHGGFELDDEARGER